MTDILHPDERRRHMARIRRADTEPERTVRDILESIDEALEMQPRDLPGHSDFVLRHARVAGLVHGCFWHAHDCEAAKVPATRPEFWSAKLDANRRRDAQALESLLAAKWRVLLAWECALRGKGRWLVQDLDAAVHEWLAGDEAVLELEGKRK